ncbi:alpha/beta hydrolase [Nocardiaceae bacterium YC2-7]|uniref:Alpha/beta hydrolase n=2 Tax=Antrihabitans stalactiti TaxID=2584121 RepID=A0A848K7R1_9NOCA|nr:alpha/beta hydrolase [Antrihabitans stalactiti]
MGRMKPSFVEVEGLRLAYRRCGDGEPLVLLHGGFSDGREMRNQLEGLSDSYDVVAWDCLGSGESSDPPAGFGLRDYATVLAGGIAELGLERPHVLGLSFGSMYALVLYRYFAQLPRTLILASAYAGWGGSLPPGEVQARVDSVVAALEVPPAEWGRDFLSTVYSAEVSDSVVDEAMGIMAGVRASGTREQLRAFAFCDLRDVLPLIEVPTLLLYGELDQRSPLAVAEDLHVAITGSRLVVLPGVGHGANMEAPDAFNDAVRRFLADH